MSENPYSSPTEAGYDAVPKTVTQFTGRKGSGRFLAAQIDHWFSIVLFLIVGSNVATIGGNAAAGIAALLSYFGYYFLPEWLLGTTIGKSLFALQVRQLSGSRCTARQVAIRTLLRLVEVNPFLLGALPAGIAILSTERNQRIGDLLAGTVVIRRSDLASDAAEPRVVRVIRGRSA